MSLLAYIFDIQHRTGSQHVVPDTLSRVHVYSLALDDVAPLIDLESVEFQSEEYLDLIEEIYNRPDELPDLKIEDKYVYKKAFKKLGEEEMLEHSLASVWSDR